jgi:hypothetical protein
MSTHWTKVLRIVLAGERRTSRYLLASHDLSKK